MDRTEKLLALAREHLGELDDGEERLLTAAARGEESRFDEGESVRARTLTWLLTDPDAADLVHHRGVRVRGATVEEDLYLAHAVVDFPLRLAECTLQAIRLTDARLECLGLSGSSAKGISAMGLVVRRDLDLDLGFESDGQVDVLGSTIGGSFDCQRSTFRVPEGRAIVADNARVRGSVFLRNGFEAEGEVNFLGATVGGAFDCYNATFRHPDGKAVNCDGAAIGGSVFLRNGFEAEGEVNFLGATVGASFDCQGGKIRNPGGLAINANRARIGGGVFLRDGFEAEGEVNFRGTAVGGSFECQGGKFSNPNGRAISADGATVTAGVFLSSGFEAQGEVTFLGGTIEGTLDCAGGKFENPGDRALSLSSTHVKGSLFLRAGFEATGEISLLDARVDGYFVCQDLSSPAFSLRLESAHLGTIYDDDSSWPTAGHLLLGGLTYGGFDPDAAAPDRRLDWIRRQPLDRYLPQPFEQLASVLIREGHEREARRVLIAKEHHRRDTRLSAREKLWHRALGGTIAFGYRPWQSGWWMLAFLVAGTFVFAHGFEAGLLEPTKTPPTTHEPNALWYSIDSFVPLIDFHQKEHWLPPGGWVRSYMWAHTAFGWILTTLLVSGLTGLVSKRRG